MKKLLSRKGFTLVETLVTLLIVTLLTGAITVGITTAVGVHGDVLFASQSDLLASALNTAIGDVLHFATDVSGETDPSFQNPAYGLDGESGQFDIIDGRLYLSNALLADGGRDHLLLVGDGMYTNLYIENFDITYSDSRFDGSYTITDGKHTKEIKFTFRPVNH